MSKARDLAAIGALSAALLAALEGGLRVVRSLGGEPASTRVERFDADMRRALAIYRRHPFTNTGPRPGASTVAFGRSVAFDSLGYRSPERPLEKLPGVRRVLCAGGSTTFDLAANDDASTWPALLEGRLRDGGRDRVEVWNAGFPGWTSAENLISFALRDGDLEPDVTVLFQGLNDLQPASHTPFDREYARGHADESRTALGLELPPLGWSERSLLLESARDLLGGARDPWQRLKLPTTGERRSALPDEAVTTFERNVRSFVALAHARRSRVLLATQVLRVRGENRAADLDYLAGWLQGLAPETAAGELERLNDVLRGMAGEGVDVLDLAASVAWEDGDFADPMHTSAAGSAKLAAAVATAVEPLLADSD